MTEIQTPSGILRIHDHVQIHTVTGGCYDKQTGQIMSVLTDDKQQAQQPGFEYNWTAPGWIRVKLDLPVLMDPLGTKVVVQDDIFMAGELTKLSKGASHEPD